MIYFRPIAKTVLESFTFGRPKVMRPTFCAWLTTSPRANSGPHRLSVPCSSRPIGTGRARRLRGGLEKQGRLSAPRHIPAGARASRGAEGVRRAAASEDSPDVGKLATPPGLSLKDLVQAPLPTGKRFLVRLSCLSPVSKIRRPAVPPARGRQEFDRRAVDRRLHDGSRKAP